MGSHLCGLSAQRFLGSPKGVQKMPFRVPILHALHGSFIDDGTNLLFYFHFFKCGKSETLGFDTLVWRLWVLSLWVLRLWVFRPIRLENS